MMPACSAIPCRRPPRSQTILPTLYIVEAVGSKFERFYTDRSSFNCETRAGSIETRHCRLTHLERVLQCVGQRTYLHADTANSGT